MNKKLMFGAAFVGIALVGLVGAEKPAAGDTPDDIVSWGPNKGGSCYVVLNRGARQGVKQKGERREVVGNITAEVMEIYEYRSLARVQNTTCDRLAAHYRAETQPKKGPTAEELAAQFAKKCETEKDRIANITDPKDKGRFLYTVYKDSGPRPSKCVGEQVVRVDTKDCGLRYCSVPAPAKSQR